jgi:hypothetical protein
MFRNYAHRADVFAGAVRALGASATVVDDTDDTDGAPAQEVQHG